MLTNFFNIKTKVPNTFDNSKQKYYYSKNIQATLSTNYDNKKSTQNFDLIKYYNQNYKQKKQQYYYHFNNYNFSIKQNNRNNNKTKNKINLLIEKNMFRKDLRRERRLFREEVFFFLINNIIFFIKKFF